MSGDDRDVASFDRLDAMAAAEARGEMPLPAAERFDEGVAAATRLDPELHAATLHAELMDAYSRENTPPSYDRDEQAAWLAAPTPEPSRTTRLEADLDRVVNANPGLFRGTRLEQRIADRERE